MLIRAELVGDVEGIDAVHASAFSRPELEGPPMEVGLVHNLRHSSAWVRAQSLVATIDDEIVGHSLGVRARVGDTPALALGPIGVRSDYQGQGVGSALINTAIDIAIEMGEPLIGLVGENAYYERFGFVPGASVGIDPVDPAWGHFFQVKLLRETPLSGVFEYPEAFTRLS